MKELYPKLIKDEKNKKEEQSVSFNELSINFNNFHEFILALGYDKTKVEIITKIFNNCK